MSDLTAKFTTLEGQLATDQTELMTELGIINENLGSLGNAITVLNNSMQAGFRSITAAQGQSGACFPCPTPSITVPSTTTTPTTVDSDHCKRSQWIISTIQSILSQFDTLQSFNVVGTFSVLNDAIGQIVGAIAAGDTIPLPSFPEGVQIAGTYINYAGERAFSGVGLSEQFSPLYGPLVTAVNLSSDASNAQAQYNGIIDASDASSGAKQLFKAIAYNALWSYAFDTTSEPDLSAFDGSACGVALHNIAACTNFGSAEVTHSGHQFYELVIPVAYVGHEGYIEGDYYGWTFEVLTNTTGHAVGIYYLDTEDSGHLAVSQQSGDDPYTFSAHTNAVAVQTLDHEPDDHPFTIRICPPS